MRTTLKTNNQPCSTPCHRDVDTNSLMSDWRTRLASCAATIASFAFVRWNAASPLPFSAAACSRTRCVCGCVCVCVCVHLYYLRGTAMPHLRYSRSSLNSAGPALLGALYMYVQDFTCTIPGTCTIQSALYRAQCCNKEWEKWDKSR